MSVEGVAGPDPRTVRQAIQWLLRIRNNAANPVLRHQCEAWRAASAQHELAWQRVQSLDAELSAHLRSVPGAQLALQTLDIGTARLHRRQALKLLSGAALAGTAAWFGRGYTPWEQWTSDFATAVGEQRSFRLPDGSTLRLNTHSAADSHFSAQQRRVNLKQGELMLSCAAEPDHRSFWLGSRDGLFEAFDARLVACQEAGYTRLSVLQGRVAMHPAQGPMVWAAPGESYRLTAQQVSPLPAPTMDLGAWADGLIVTQGMPLREFLAQVSRYRHGLLGCSDAVAELRLSGVFRLQQPEQLIDLLPQLLPVRLRSRTRWWINVEALA